VHRAAVATVIIRRDRIEVEIRNDAEQEDQGWLVMPFAPTLAAQKGIAHEAAKEGQIDAVARERLLNAIGRATSWVEAVGSGEAKSFEEIAVQEGIGGRHLRWLTRLAFVAPNVLNSILDESAPAGCTIADLAHALAHSWAAQERRSTSVVTRVECSLSRRGSDQQAALV
jgi:hypothetical protein